MKIVAIIAEYNPFHNGHAYHIQQAKKENNADYVIVVMSGNFTQRGIPAIMPKHLRTKMALSCGADLVLELPTSFACSSAPDFAKGAIVLLNYLGVVTTLSFGSECGDITLLERIVDLIHTESHQFSQLLKDSLREGIAYPKAFSTAFATCYPEEISLLSLLNTPNNLLGIEYIRAIRDSNSSIIPTTIKRKGSDYLEETLSSTMSSALAIRNVLLETGDLFSIKDQVPACAYEILQSEYKKSFPVQLDNFSQLLSFQLRIYEESGYTRFLDVNETLSNRIRNHINEFRSFSQFCDLIKTREYTYARVCRCLLHIMLSITRTKHLAFARMLGFRKESTPLLKQIKECSMLPLISKLSDANYYLCDNSRDDLALEIFYSQVYHIVVQDLYKKDPYNEYTENIVRI